MPENPAASLAALRGLHAVLTRVSGVRGLDATLQAVVDGVVEGVGFGVAAVNCRRPDGSFQMLAVSGSVDAREALLGRVSAPDAYEKEFARADSWGSLRFVPTTARWARSGGGCRRPLRVLPQAAGIRRTPCSPPPRRVRRAGRCPVGGPAP